MGKFIGFIMLILVAAMILQAIFGVISSAITSFGDFLFNSYWGIIAIIAGGFSVFFFYVSSRMPKQLKTQGRAVNSLKIGFLGDSDDTFKDDANDDSNNKSDDDSNENSNTELLTGMDIFNMNKDNNNKKLELDNPVIDLSCLNLEGLVRELAFTMNKPAPVIFKGWGNRRLQLDIERIRLMKDYIASMREAGDEFIGFQADSVLSFEKIKTFTETRYNNLKIDLLRSKNELELLRTSLDHEKEKQKLEIEKMKIELEKEKASIEKMKAEADSIRTKSRRDEERARILKQAAKYYKDLSPALQAYITTQLGSDSPNVPDNDFELQEALRDVIQRKQTAEARKVEAEADESEEMKNFLKWKHEQAKKKREE